jgi:Tol biopolymer transport system component
MKAKKGFTLIISILLWACLQANGHQVTNLSKLTNGPLAEAEPSFNFDGTKITYRYFYSPYSWNNCNIWVINPDGSGNTRLTTVTGHESNPRFAPDDRVSYTKILGSNDNDIWISNSDGTNPHQLISGTNRQQEPHWNPSGTKIIYYSEYQYGGPGEIWSVNADGISGKVRLTNHAIDKIAYANQATVGADMQIWIMNADGSEKHQITTNPGYHAPMFWWPDDSRIGYTKNGDVWLYNLSTDTEELLLSVPKRVSHP